MFEIMSIKNILAEKNINRKKLHKNYKWASKDINI